MEALLSERAVLGGPDQVSFTGFCSEGAAEDGRAPTEELPWLRSKNFCRVD